MRSIQLLRALCLVCAVSLATPKPAVATEPPHAAQLVAELTVQSIARSLEFYQKLGFAVARREKTFAELQWKDGHKLFLSEDSARRAAPEKPVMNLRIGVENVDAVWALAQAAQARVITTPGDRFYGERDFVICDPDGFGLR